MDAQQLRRAVNATLMPGFEGPVLPPWLAAELADGLGSVCLFSTNVTDPVQLRSLTDAIHAANPGCLVAVDEEGGDVTRLHHRHGSPYPSTAYLGRLDDEAVTEQVAAGIGAELLAAGIDLNLAPDADVNSNPRNPVIGVRSFGSTPALVARHVAAYTRGLQAAGVGAVAKHFPGHGDTATDSHRELPTIDVATATLVARELVPFGAAVHAGTVAVMTSHIMVPTIDPNLPATLSAELLALLRDRFGFTGAIVSDALDMAGASAGRGIPEAAVLALAAGVDLLCIGTDNSAEQLAEIRRALLSAVHDGRLPVHRVLRAAERVAALSRRVAELRATATGAASAAPPPRFGPAGFALAHPVRPLRAPVLVRLHSPANIAAGDTVWGLGPHLAAELDAQLPGHTCMAAHDLDELDAVLLAHPDRALVVQGRDLARVPFLAAAVDVVRRSRPDALLVELGWPDDTSSEPADIATYGSGRGTMLALIELLALGTR